VLKPEGSVDLEVGKRYVLTIESKQKITEVEKHPAFDISEIVKRRTRLCG